MISSRSRDWNNHTWDAQRLVREYVKLAAYGLDKQPFKELSWSNKIYILRVASVIRAFMGESLYKTKTPNECIKSIFGLNRHQDNNVLELSPIDEDDKKIIVDLLTKWQDEDMQQFLMGRNVIWRPLDRLMTMDILFCYRLVAQKLIDMHNNWLECSMIGSMAINAGSTIYNPNLFKANEEIDKIIALLLGSSFKKTLSVKELMEKHNYPKETDEQIFNYEIDNY